MSSFKTSLSSWKAPAVVPRKRTVNEQRDLAVRLIGELFKPLSFYYGVIAIPTYLFNCLLWLFIFPDSLNSDLDTFETALWSAVIVWLTISLETQFVGSLATQYLGVWLFSDSEKITKKQIFQNWWGRVFQIFYYLVLTRLIRLRAYYPEIILLERPPFWGNKQIASTSRRARLINSGGIRGMALSTVFANEAYLISGVLSGYALILPVVNAIFPDPRLSILIVNFVAFPIFVFGCKLFNVVFEFCSYINFRISYEGWDVDLAFRTEAPRLGIEEDFGNDVGVRRNLPSRSRTLAPLIMDFTSERDSASEIVEWMRER